MEDIRGNIAGNISLLRKSIGMTQLDLAEKLNYSDKAVSKWERGESVPDIEGLKTIADFFGITVDGLISDNALNYVVKKEKKEVSRRVKIVVTSLALLLVWLLATIAFFVLDIVLENIKIRLLSFVYALPVSFTVWLIFNSIWFNKRFNYVIISFLMWSVLFSVCVSFAFIGDIGLLALLLLGIPGEAIIIVWSLNKARKER